MGGHGGGEEVMSRVERQARARGNVRRLERTVVSLRRLDRVVSLEYAVIAALLPRTVVRT